MATAVDQAERQFSSREMEENRLKYKQPAGELMEISGCALLRPEFHLKWHKAHDSSQGRYLPLLFNGKYLLPQQLMKINLNREHAAFLSAEAENWTHKWNTQTCCACPAYVNIPSVATETAVTLTMQSRAAAEVYNEAFFC